MVFKSPAAGNAAAVESHRPVFFCFFKEMLRKMMFVDEKLDLFLGRFCCHLGCVQFNLKRKDIAKKYLKVVFDFKSC